MREQFTYAPTAKSTADLAGPKPEHVDILEYPQATHYREQINACRLKISKIENDPFLTEENKLTAIQHQFDVIAKTEQELRAIGIDPKNIMTREGDQFHE